MLSEDDARRVAQEHLNRESITVGHELVVADVQPFEHGWVFFYETAEFLRSRDWRHRLGGNAPLLVDRRNGSLHVTGTVKPTEHHVAEYLRSHP